MARMSEATEQILQANHPDAWAEVVALRNAVEGLMEIAETAMPDTYFQTDSRVNAARNALAPAHPTDDR